MIAIVEAHRASAAVLAALHLAGFPDDPWDAGAFARLLALPGVRGRVALAGTGGEPAGFALWQAVLDEAELLTITVRPDRRGQGLGKALMADGLRLLAAAGVGSLLLEVAADNPVARRLYGDLGFSAVGSRRGYYARKGRQSVDAFILKREIDTVDTK